MKRTFFLALGLSIAVVTLAGRAFADGAYQRTDDRKKTIVWNNDPQPGDTAEWKGERDSEGYAEGPGTLTWSRTQNSFATGSNIASNKKVVPISRLTGTMTHGKFVGAVTTVDHGKTYHAKYVDGQRKGNWSLGPVVAKASTVEAAPEPQQPKKVSQPKIAASEKANTPTAPKVSEEAEPEPPTEGPDSTNPEITDNRPQVTAESAARTEEPKAPLIAQTQVDDSATPRQQPVTRKGALAPGAVRAIDQPGRETPKKIEKAKPAAPRVKATPKPEPTIVERELKSPAEGPRAVKAEKPQTPNPKTQNKELSEPPAQKVPTEDLSQSSTPNSQLSSEEDSTEDNSLRTLTGPPSSLRTKSAAAPPAATTPEPPISIAPASSAAAQPKLNAVQAMDIADIEARTKGYDLGEYQLPKAEYNAADDTWSVSYIGRDKNTKRLHVAIQDKSGKAEVKK